MKSRRPVLYPFLIAVYPVAALYAQNTSSTPWYDLLLPVAIVTGATALLWLLTWPVVREPARAALLTLLALVVFDTIVLAPGWVDETLMQLSAIWVQAAVHVWRPLVMGSELALAALVAYFIVRMKEPRCWTTGLNIFALILLAFPIATTVRTLTKHHGQTTQAVESAGIPPAAISSAARVGRLPDVYYIILDGYARADVMADHFGLNVEPFLKRLERKGFFIARRSTANYCQTPLSLSSSLNATYLNGLMPADWEDTNPLSRWIGDGAVVRTFKGLGYRFVTFATSFAQTEHPEAEFYFSPYGYSSPFHHMLLDLTPLAPFAPVPRMLESYTVTRDQTLYVFDKVPQIARWGAPTFTFAHILSPHPPFVFGKNGEDVSPRESPYVLTDGDVFREWYGERARLCLRLPRSGRILDRESRANDRTDPGELASAAGDHPSVRPRVGPGPLDQEPRANRPARTDEHPERLLLARKGGRRSLPEHFAGEFVPDHFQCVFRGRPRSPSGSKLLLDLGRALQFHRRVGPRPPSVGSSAG